MDPTLIIMRTVLDRLYLFAGFAAGGFMILIFVLMMVLSAGRPLGVNVPAGDDLVAWSMVAMSFLGLAHTFRSGEMIRVGLLIDLLGGRTRRTFEIGALLIGCGFIAFFAWYAVLMTYDSWQFHDRAQGVLPVPLWIPQLGYAGGARDPADRIRGRAYPRAPRLRAALREAETADRRGGG